MPAERLEARLAQGDLRFGSGSGLMMAAASRDRQSQTETRVSAALA
jgi:hypothetical protein